MNKVKPNKTMIGYCFVLINYKKDVKYNLNISSVRINCEYHEILLGTTVSVDPQDICIN